jgi:hypothetical protein
MKTKNVVGLLVNVLVALAVTAAVFMPILFLLAATPLHDGSDSPSQLLLYTTGIVSVGVGVLAVWFLRWLLHRRSRVSTHA